MRTRCPTRLRKNATIFVNFAGEVRGVFEKGARVQTLWQRRAALLRNEQYQAVPELAEAMALLEAGKFKKAVAFVYSQTAAQVRTNNHVERMNRVLRLYEKTRYKWRTARTKVRFVWLLVDRRWGVQARAWAMQPGGGAGQAAWGQTPSNPAATEPHESEQRWVA